jgi:hypothetical protein
MENETEGTTPEQETKAPETEALGDAGKRALDAERKARQAAEKQLREAQAKLKEADDAGKSDLERLQGQVADLTKRAEAAEAKADRFEVAAAKGLSLAQARRLVGGTKEELEQDADEMRSELGLDKERDEQDKETPAKSGRPKEDLKLGASNTEDEQPNPGKLADSILRSSF